MALAQLQSPSPVPTGIAFLAGLVGRRCIGDRSSAEGWRPIPEFISRVLSPVPYHTQRAISHSRLELRRRHLSSNDGAKGGGLWGR